MFALLILFASCNHEPNVTVVDYPATGGGRIYFLTQPKEQDHDSADLLGELMLNDGCFQVQHEGANGVPATIIWPVGFGISIDEETVGVFNDNGQPVVTVGERVLLGGSSSGGDSDRHGKCGGPFWYASPMVLTGDDIP